MHLNYGQYEKDIKILFASDCTKHPRFNNYRMFKPSNQCIDNKSGFQTPPSVKTIVVPPGKLRL